MLSQYTSIDTTSSNWCALHALSCMYYHNMQRLEYDLPVDNPASEADLADLGYNEEEIAIMLPTAGGVNINNQLFVDHYNNATKRLAIQNNLEKKLKDALTDEGKRNAYSRLKNQYNEIIAISREISLFIEKNRINGELQPVSAEMIKDQLSPLFFLLYKKISALPASPEEKAEYEIVLSALLGIEKENIKKFITSMERELRIPALNNPEQEQNYGDNVRERLGQQIPVQEDFFPVPGGMKHWLVSEPTTIKNEYQFSVDMVSDLALLLFPANKQPEINNADYSVIHDFDMFGSNADYVIKASNGHMNILIKNDDVLGAEKTTALFTEENGFNVKTARSGWSYFFGTLQDSLWTLAKGLGVLLAAAAIISLIFFRQPQTSTNNASFQRAGQKTAPSRPSGPENHSDAASAPVPSRNMTFRQNKKQQTPIVRQGKKTITQKRR